MTQERLYLSAPHMGGKELDYIHSAFDQNWIAPLGPNVDGFEAELSAYTGQRHIAALSSGTAAIHLALILLGVKQGDSVLCQSFTFSATANPIVYQGANPIFIDSEPDSWNMDPGLLEEAIKAEMAAGKKPKAIIYVHLYGMPAKVDEIEDIGARYGIPTIEDAAEALGSSYKGSKTGGFGHFGVFSFNGNKIITTSGGGALTSHHKEEIEKARFLATQARDQAPHYQHSQIGYNYRMSNISAGIGRGQLCVLEQWISNRRANYAYYKDQLQNIEGIDFLDEPNGHFSNRWLSCILIDASKFDGRGREEVRLALEKSNIESRPLWKPMHLQPVFEGYSTYVNGVSERLFEKGLCLPSSSSLTDKNLDHVVSVIKNTLIK